MVLAAALSPPWTQRSLSARGKWYLPYLMALEVRSLQGPGGQVEKTADADRGSPSTLRSSELQFGRAVAHAHF